MSYKYLLCLLLIVGSWMSANGRTIEDKVRDEIKKFESASSGFPINCRRFVDQFTDNGIIEFPQAIGTKTIMGQRNMFKYCELNILPEFDQIETFISGDIYVHGLTAVFERTLLLVSKWRCRFIFKGITQIELNSDLKITKMTNYWNYDESYKSYKSCTLDSEDLNSSHDDGTTPQFVAV